MPLVTGADFGLNFAPGAGKHEVQSLNALTNTIAGIGKQRAEQKQAQQLAQAQAAQKNLMDMSLNLFDVAKSTGDFPQKKRKALELAKKHQENSGDLSMFDSILTATGDDEFTVAVTNLGRKALSAKETAEMLVKRLSPSKEDQFTLGEGQTRFSSSGDVIAKGEEEKPKPQTDIGKMIYDKELVVKQFGEDSPQVAAFNDAIAAEEKGEKPSLSDVSGIRKEFTKQSAPFIEMRDAFNKIQSASDSGAGDVSLIFGFMKLIDPGSTVREGEFATAEQTAGIPARITTLYNKALKGDRLGAEQRTAFKNEAGNLFESQLQTQRQIESVFRGLSERQGINPEDVVLDFAGESRQFNKNQSSAPDEVDQDIWGEMTESERALFK